MFENPTRPILAAFAFALALNGASALAAGPAPMEAALARIAHDWAQVTFTMTDEDAQNTRLKALADQAAQVVASYPDRAEPLIWEAVILSGEAKTAGTFSALGYAKQSRDLLEKAERLDYRALDGAVPTSLGALYYLVPGFPLGFGDNDKARQYLEQAVEMSPTGLDANYFYGDFLYQEGEYKQATVVLKRALTAPVNAQRPVWDTGRRAQIRDLLSKVDAKLAADG
ncbi:Tetratricopeptide repeat-containing protein [Tistlia consotensis]|uniref:Tetratricopeptide repeat-containing protein n=1 Tax=Tistlia consotensis USBA 355 TaxID=560819 RepID=A0A1Y6CEK5_9PROT|nr:tetratricopeptide repeat protein [Tistlia consotensis]SMF60169.1 Tetratricopeptide repeat-containing protein [Tistlia consotensis USBA 355]SNR93736.1 Tetratricopeptide repeat-containing protein [Tistlia consotensis]